MKEANGKEGSTKRLTPKRYDKDYSVGEKEIDKMPVFSWRLQGLIDKEKINQRTLVEKLGLSTATVNAYLKPKKSTNEYTAPRADVLIMLAKFFNVSADYLLGLSTTKSSNIKIVDICKMTGLSEEAISVLVQLKQMGRGSLISEFICDPKFSEALYRMQEAIEIKTVGDHHYSVLSTTQIDKLQKGEDVEMTEMRGMDVIEIYISIASKKISDVINKMVFSKERRQ